MEGNRFGARLAMRIGGFFYGEEHPGFWAAQLVIQLLGLRLLY